MTEAVGAEPRVMGLDYGERRIGIALSDPLGLTAQPLTTLQRVSLEKDLGTLADLLGRHQVRRVVIGLPLSLKGEKGERARAAEGFGRRLEHRTGVPVESWDERLTSVQAERALLEGDVSRRRRREVIDRTAAVFILQSWLDARGAGHRA
jgi:putative Holliday junction resolvase